MDKLLFDASSIIYSLKLRKIRILAGNYVQWLTVYEVVNAIWKEAGLVGSLSLKEAKELLEIFLEVLEHMTILEPRSYELKILNTALERGLTAYDASYVVLAREKGLKLVTEDSKLRERAGELVETSSLDQLLRNHYSQM